MREYILIGAPLNYGAPINGIYGDSQEAIKWLCAVMDGRYNPDELSENQQPTKFHFIEGWTMVDLHSLHKLQICFQDKPSKPTSYTISFTRNTI